jgi:3-oxoacyl-[acyl-carrier protein] reductase
VDLGLTGRVALVTAASKGLGLASALALADEGARVAVCARGPDDLRRAEARLAERTEVLAVFGGLDVLVGNSGGPPPVRALEVDEQGLVDALNANLLAQVRLVQAAVPHMRAGGWGRVCLITSSAVKQPIPDLALSNTARSGLWGWAKTAAADLFADGITLNLACPGLHATDRLRSRGAPAGEPVGDPADFGRVVAFLCSEPARFVSGTAVLVDGARNVCLG